jgi:hypothetical protein
LRSPLEIVIPTKGRDPLLFFIASTLTVTGNIREEIIFKNVPRGTF